jgi:hypothetical protein
MEEVLPSQRFDWQWWPLHNTCPLAAGAWARQPVITNIALLQFSLFFFLQIFNFFGLKYHWKDSISRNAHLVHQNWYRISFTKYHNVVLGFSMVFVVIANLQSLDISIRHWRQNGVVLFTSTTQ